MSATRIWALSWRTDFGRRTAVRIGRWPGDRRRALDRSLEDFESDGLTGRLAALLNRVVAGRFTRAGVLHDACCRLAGKDWALRGEADRVFRMAMLDLAERHRLGVRGCAVARAMWFGVRAFAWIDRACPRCAAALYAIADGR